MQVRTLVPAALAVTATAVVGGLASRPADCGAGRRGQIHGSFKR